MLFDSFIFCGREQTFRPDTHTKIINLALHPVALCLDGDVEQLSSLLYGYLFLFDQRIGFVLQLRSVFWVRLAYFTGICLKLSEFNIN